MSQDKGEGQSRGRVAVKAITVEESQHCESRALDRSPSGGKTVRVVQETDLEVGE